MTTGKLSPTPRSAFKVQVYIVKLLKKRLKRLYILQLWLNLCYKTKDEVYHVLNKWKIESLKKYLITKYHKQNKPTSTFEAIKRSEPIKRSEADAKEDTINHNKRENEWCI